MKFTTHTSLPTTASSDLLVLFAQKTGKTFSFYSSTKSVDQALNNLLTQRAKDEAFDGANGSQIYVHTRGDIQAKRVLVLGLGKTDDITMQKWLEAVANMSIKTEHMKVNTLSLCLPDQMKQLSVEALAYGVVLGCTIRSYKFLTYKSEEAKKKAHFVESCDILAPENIASTVAEAEHVSAAITFARDLINESPSVTTPTYLGNVAKKLADGAKITAEVLDEKAIQKLGMGGLLGIARGSDEPPRFIHLSYNIGAKKTIALVGKGITFDTGGLSLKPASGMETMKLDMAGAATILGIFSIIKTLQLKVNVVGLISATENMPGAKAVKPGDVVRAMNGKTIEILNTDAEGRVVLADALSYAVEKVKPDAMIDLATLTGACMVALGNDIAGVFSNNNELTQALTQAATTSGEKVWELPLVEDYKEQIKSPIADIKNIGGGRYGGAITGALFLQEFVPDSIPWAHMDIAGPSFSEREHPLYGHGATGFGVRMLVEYLRSFSG